MPASQASPAGPSLSPPTGDTAAAAVSPSRPGACGLGRNSHSLLGRNRPVSVALGPPPSPVRKEMWVMWGTAPPHPFPRSPKTQKPTFSPPHPRVHAECAHHEDV